MMLRLKLTSCLHAVQNSVLADTVKHSFGISLTHWPEVTDFGLLEQDGCLHVPPRDGFVNTFLFLVNSDFLGALNLSNKKTTLLLLASEVVIW